MITLLLAACLTPPFFGEGPVCTPARQEVQCGCGECFQWDASPGAELYPILRRNPNGTIQWVADVMGYGGDGSTDPETGELIPFTPPATQWCFAKDPDMPVEGLRYVYEVRSCARGVCTPWSGAVSPPSRVVYVAAPYWCYDHEVGGRVVCPHR